MIEQLIISLLFISLISSLVLTDWPPAWVFTCTMLAAYFLGLVDISQLA